MTRKEIGIVVQKRRKSLGWSQNDLKERLGDGQISEATIRRIEQGNDKVSLNTLALVLDILEIPGRFLTPAEQYLFRNGVDGTKTQILEERIRFLEGAAWIKSGGYPIKTLSELVLFLPLIPDPIMSAIEISVAEYTGSDVEEYAAKLLELAYLCLPRSEDRKRIEGIIKDNRNGKPRVQNAGRGIARMPENMWKS